MPSSFEEGTTEATWGLPGSEDKYMLRYIHEETCCSAPYGEVADWPVIEFTAKWSPEEEDSEDYDFCLSVIAGLWVQSSGKFIGFWGADAGDGHVDFYCRDDCEVVDELGTVSAVLCEEIAPALIDVFDDGSGSEREPRLVPAAVFSNDLLNNMYSSSATGDGDDSDGTAGDRKIV